MPLILVVDDSPVARLAASRALRARALEVLEHDSVASAEGVDVRALAGALLDLELGDGLGTDVAEALRRERPSLPIAFFTSATGGAARERAASFGPVFVKDAVADAVSWLGERVKTTLAARTISVAIERTPRDVYAFVCVAENLPLWAPGLCSGVRRDAEGILVDTPAGSLRFAFALPNDLGVLDHTVTLPSGESVHVPMRVVPNGGGSEVLFTLLRPAGASDEAFEADVALVRADLERLRVRLEQG